MIWCACTIYIIWPLESTATDLAANIDFGHEIPVVLTGEKNFRLGFYRRPAASTVNLGHGHADHLVGYLNLSKVTQFDAYGRYESIVTRR